MLMPERFEIITRLVNEKGTATVEELAEALDVSRATIRRDLAHLDADKVILRTHGGAIKYDKSLTKEVPIYLRIHMQKAEKEQVADAAVDMISEGDTIFIGAGTTGRALSSKLDRFSHLTIVTNDIDVAKEISKTDNALMVLGGQLKSSSCTLLGFFTEEMLRELRVDTAFMAADAVDVENGFRDFNVDEISFKRLVLSVSARTIMMCDTSKFRKHAFVNICPFSAVSALITNEDADANSIALLREAGLQVILAPKK